MAPKYIVADFETYYDTEYSLKRMTPVEYILDRRFEMNVVAICEDDNGPAFTLEHDDFCRYLNTLRGNPVAVLSHNALFDMCILSYRYGWTPPLMIDTMGMARALIYPQTGKVSLAACVEYFGVGKKGGFLANVRGLYKDQIKARGLWEGHCRYAMDDATQERDIFKAMRPHFPRSEYAVMDQVLRCAVQPSFVLDAPLLHEHYADVVRAKEELLQRTGLTDRKALMSDVRFAEVLEGLGVEPPTKVSPTTNKTIYAFAKSDKDFVDLMENHPNPDVQAVCAARLGHKSTIEETRTQRFINISRLTWADGSSGAMPMPLRYSGAHTHRLSGDWKLNVQNLGRGSKLRHALKAMPGMKVVAVDASQIEARMNGWFSGEEELTNAFAAGEDIYSLFAGEAIYGYPVSKATHKDERFVGKQSILGLGYNMGAPKFQNTVRVASRNELKREMIIPEEECRRIVQAYRRRYANITARWKTLQQLLPQMAMQGFQHEMGPVRFIHNAIVLPNGMLLQYHNLRNMGDGQWAFDFGKRIKYIYGGKMLENIIQALARICTMDAAVRVARRYHNYGVRLASQVHDEIIFVVPEWLAEEVKLACIEEMRRRPWWGPDIPLDAEGATGLTYGDCK